MILLHIFLASSYLKLNKSEGVIAILSLIGITLGVSSLIIVLSTMNGFHATFLDKILGIYGHIDIHNYGQEIQDHSNQEKMILDIDGVEFVIPHIYGSAIATHQELISGIFVYGLEPDKLRHFSHLIIKNDFELDNDSIIVGARLAENLKINIGSTINLISGTTSTIIGSIPRTKSYNVVGIIESGLLDHDSTFTYITMNSAQKLFRHKNPNKIEVFLNEPEKAGKIANTIDNSLIEGRTFSWKKKNKHYIEALSTERKVMFLILVIIVVIASFNVLSSMIMLVRSKKKEIAILRTMGMSKLDIAKSFFLCGSLIGVLGTIIGVLIGLGISNNPEIISKSLDFYLSQDSEMIRSDHGLVPIKILSTDVLKTCIVSISLSCLSTIYPCFLASKVEPADVLRYE